MSLPLMPVRRLHNYAYCPRLFYYQWVENIFVENADTAAGSRLHRNTDRPSHWKEDLDLAERASVRSLSLSSEKLGLTGKIDLIEDTGSGRELIDYKKGSSTKDEDGNRIAKENDTLQIAAYALLLKEEGIEVSRASIYYGAQRRRVPVPLDDELFARTRARLAEARAVAESETCPPPLTDDPRCLHCSAYPVCLPNESAFWNGLLPEVPKDKEPPRPPGDEGEVLILQNPRAYVGKRGGEIVVRVEKETVSKIPIEQLQSITLYGGIQVSTQALHACLERAIPVSYFSPAGRFLGMTSGLPQSGVDARLGQYRLFGEQGLRVRIAAEAIRAKIHNQRVLLMRNGSASETVHKSLSRLRDKAVATDDLDTLRGIEGTAAALYFEHFSTMLKDRDIAFDFNGRNRRPPRDPVNALLSLGYSILAKEITGILHTVGLDPYLGFFHQPRYGRPALALDLMEEFRPLVADSVALSLFNRGELSSSDFVHTSSGVFLGDGGRRQFWRAWSRRLDTEVRHPEFGYRMSYRRMIDVQARQLWRYCRGEATAYHGFTTR